MVKAAEYIQRDYNASQMFNEDGSVNTEAYQKTMLQYTGTDLKQAWMKEKFLKAVPKLKIEQLKICLKLPA